MFGIIKDSFKLTNRYIILATPLILFTLVSNLYLLFSAGGKPIGLMFAILLFFLMLGAFLSGWFYMVKECVSNPELDDINGLLMEFTSGVGEYFIPACTLIVMFFIVSLVFMLIFGIAGMKLIGDITPVYQGLLSASSSADALKTYLTGLSVEQLIKLNEWNILLFFAVLIPHLLLMFYAPAMFFKQKNPFKAFFVSVKDLFCRKFFQNVFLFVIIVVTYIILSVISSAGGSNIIVHFVMTLANFYFIVFVAICIFNYYYKNYVQIGANIDERV